MSLGALKDAPKTLAGKYTDELRKESQDSLEIMFGEGDVKSQALLRSDARKFYNSGQSFGDYYGPLGVSELIEKFDNLEKNKP
jgi:hypothetical protein